MSFWSLLAKKRFALTEETDLEATTEESIECISSSDPEKSKKEETFSSSGKVRKLSLIISELLSLLSPLETSVCVCDAAFKI